MTPRSVPSSGTDAPGTLAADRVADVLLMFLTNPAPLGVSDVARSLDLSKAVVHRILQSLVSRRLVEEDPADQRYRLGPAMVEFGLAGSYGYDSSWQHLGAAALAGLTARTGETATLSARIGAMRAFVDQAEGSSIIHLSVALWRPRPLGDGASGKAILAFLDPSAREQIIAHRLPPPGCTHRVDRRQLEEELAQVRRDQVAVSRGEVVQNAMGVAAPILRRGEPIGAVGICLSAMSGSRSTELRSIVREAGRVLSAKCS